MHRYQFTHAGIAVIPFGFRPAPDAKYSAAAHVGDHTWSFPEQQFETDREAAKHAEIQARAMIDSGEIVG